MRKRSTYLINQSIDHDCALRATPSTGFAKYYKNNQIYYQDQKALYFAMIIVLIYYTYKLQHQSYPNLKFEAQASIMVSPLVSVENKTYRLDFNRVLLSHSRY